MDTEPDAQIQIGLTDDETRSPELSRKDYLSGIGLLLIVVFLWTSSNFITQDIFDDGYEKPFLVTYLNTSSFTVYLIPWTIRSLIKQRDSHKANQIFEGYEPVSVTDTLEAPTTTVISNLRAPSILSEDLRVSEDLHPLTTGQTARLASVFCIFWFIANWSVNASLDFTSVASATILSSTSGFFTLLAGRLVKVETLTIAKTSAVVCSFIGVVLVSASDSVASETGDLIKLNTLHLPQVASAVFGDCLALLSAAFYALYVILLKVRIKEESRIDMQLFFGFVGLFNVIMLWPVGILLHVTGIEPVQLPPSRRAWTALLVNMFITFSSDYIYVLAMLKTTPLVVTIGLSLTIPLAIVGDFFLKIPTSTQAVLGGILVLAAFVVVGVQNSDLDQRRKADHLDEVNSLIEGEIASNHSSHVQI